MMPTAAFSALFVLSLAWTVVANGKSLQDPCLEHVYEKVQTCFAQQGLHLTVTPGQQDAKKILRETQAVDPVAQCQKLSSYKAAISCTLNVLKMCLAAAGMAGAIPDVNSFQQGMDVVCARQHELNNECLKTRYSDILTCAERVMRAAVKETDSGQSIDDIICMSADVNYDCASEYLKVCGNETLDIFLQQLDKYQTPTACVNRRPGRAGRKHYNVVAGSRAAHCVTSSLSCLAAVASLALLLVNCLH